MLRLNQVHARCDGAGINYETLSYRDVYIPGGIVLFFATEPGLNLSQLTHVIDERLDGPSPGPRGFAPSRQSEQTTPGRYYNIFQILEGKDAGYKKLIKFYSTHGPLFSVPQLLRFAPYVLHAIRQDTRHDLMLHKFLDANGLAIPRIIQHNERQADLFVQLSNTRGIEYLTRLISAETQSNRQAKLEQIFSRSPQQIEADITRVLQTPVEPRIQPPLTITIRRTPTPPSAPSSRLSGASPAPTTPRPGDEGKRPRFGN